MTIKHWKTTSKKISSLKDDFSAKVYKNLSLKVHFYYQLARTHLNNGGNICSYIFKYKLVSLRVSPHLPHLPLI